MGQAWARLRADASTYASCPPDDHAGSKSQHERNHELARIVPKARVCHMDAERSSTASRQTRSRSAPGQEEACTQAAEKQLCQRLVEGCKAIEHSRGGGSLELALTRGLNMNDCFLNVRREGRKESRAIFYQERSNNTAPVAPVEGSPRDEKYEKSLSQ